MPKQRLVAIDPGDVHCGVAMFLGDECYSVVELGPEACKDMVWLQLRNDAIDVLVIEEFRLYPDRAKEQSYSEFPTCQLIGALKEIHRTCVKEHECNTQLVMQPASAKKPTFAQLRARKVKSRAKLDGVSGQHVLDAEAHGWHYILKNKEQP